MVQSYESLSTNGDAENRSLLHRTSLESQTTGIKNLREVTNLALTADTPGQLDPTFGTDGIVTTSLGVSAIAHSVAIQSDGKIVAGGGAGISLYDFALVRYNTNGSIDDSFGSAGIVTTDFANSNDTGVSVAIQSDGKIVAAGTSVSGGREEIALARYNLNGSLDPSFGILGKVTTLIGPGSQAVALAIQSDSKIVVAGKSFRNSTFPYYGAFAVARYNTNGSLDSSFGSGGTVTTRVGHDPFNEVEDEPAAVAVQSDGKIVVAGATDSGFKYNFTLVRYDSNGLLDLSFGSGRNSYDADWPR